MRNYWVRYTLCLLAVCVFVVCVGIGMYHEGEKAGAKIALSIDAPNAYRANEVRGDCSNLFSSHECAKCHDADWLSGK